MPGDVFCTSIQTLLRKVCWCSLLSLRSVFSVSCVVWVMAVSRRARLVILADSSPLPTKKIELLQSQWHGYEVVIAFHCGAFSILRVLDHGVSCTSMTDQPANPSSQG